MEVVVLETGLANVASVTAGLRRQRVQPRLSTSAADVEKAEALVLPGVGAFGDAMTGLRERGLVEPLKAAARAGTPILGICVGCQLMLTRGEEFGDYAGLDLIPGTVSRLPAPRSDDAAAIRIPNVGWRRLDRHGDAVVLGAIGPEDMMYFVHSYAPMASDPATIAATIPVNGHAVPVAIEQGALVGVQFHPEKSGPAGLRLLKRFAGIQR